jgi:hypothetical protein
MLEIALIIELVFCLYVTRQWSNKITECGELRMENDRLKGSMRMIRELNSAPMSETNEVKDGS